ncbi:hypothetical protein HRR83_004425 [Exophiala dermatitidis]|uniref:Alpha-N-arabinofuranosidase n=2 Tax=Exophiala dermatitidis TaxID=5970 RepID=H6BQB0_EXODN|nr:alpha-N-arabinofuranosidase [Exophiala dermatitidis NIH/UT8656]KAJ4515854.1 hypothetical protein HRR75_003936 [Exophiala dermatitidis]EHY53780.1 alpha-N-arabinofuranosidase [Exophiala dermatitidis NIH/UT8656]KAJ4519551.1 hypothetical protein HRR74_004295 [Exophiala dermatitidis]KAJ4529369.1 hypothetical protein HRR73_000392 [Exophiala dermatitidis]KAJ4543977.1 hypothetical protein HRR76_002052 [Exophiala dermatitidis]
MSNHPTSDTDTPDPWMISANNRFYLTFTAGDRVEIWSSPTMEDFRPGNPQHQQSVVWKPTPGTPWSTDIWAPELHRLNDTWYIYFCAAHPGEGNPSHRTILLRSRNEDPMDPRGWEFLGPLKGLPDHWNIDATVFEISCSPTSSHSHQGGATTKKLYCCYSGWPLGDHSDTQQDLFLVELASPEQAVPETLTCISRAELPWERPDGGRRGVNEGPTWVEIPTAGSRSESGLGSGESYSFRGIVYSANGSWTSDYKLGVLELVGGTDDPLQPSSWRKRPTPLLESDRRQGGPFGPGHASFIVFGQARCPPQIFCIYHATANEGEGWNNRKARVLCLSPDHFQPQAQTICCADAAIAKLYHDYGLDRGYGHGYGVGPQQQRLQQPASSGREQYVYPGQMAQSQTGVQYQDPNATAGHGGSGQGAGQRKSFLDKIGDKVLKRLKDL